MGSGFSKKSSSVTDDLESGIDMLQIPWIEDGYPPPVPPSTARKNIFLAEDFAEIDRRARNTKIDNTTRYDILLYMLVEHCTNDLQKVRAIFTWLGAQQNLIQNGNFRKVKKLNGPMGYMKLLHESKGTYSAFFAHLCRQAGIPCVIIFGVSKSFDYNVGDMDILHLRNCWNAVYVERGWRLIHPLWSCRKVKDYKQSHWKVHGSASQPDDGSEGRTLNIGDDFFFLVDPKIFIYMCRPVVDMTAWQLLPDTWSLEKFIHAPVYRKSYFLFDLTLESTDSCILVAERGDVEVVFAVNENHDFVFTQELFFDNRTSFADIPKGTALEKYCFISKKNNKVSFHVRCPVSGIYKLHIYGGVSRLYNLCDFRIVCEGACKNAKPYPLLKAVMFGYTEKSKEMGLGSPSEYGGIIKLKSGQGKFLTFETEPGMDVAAALYHPHKTQEEMKNFVATKIREMCFDEKKVYVNVYVNLPSADQLDEYALHVYTKGQGEGDRYRNAVNYLLVMDGHPNDTPKSLQNETRVQQALDDLVVANRRSVPSVGELDTALMNAETLQVDNDDVMEEVKEKIALLELKRDLRLAVDHRNADVLDKVIRRGRDHGRDEELDDLLVIATAVREQLLRLRTFLLDVLQIRQPTISEIHNYTRPKPVVHDIMKAVYILLGEDERNLLVWEYIQLLMREVGPGSLLNRLKLFDVVHVDRARMEQAHRLLDIYGDDVVREASVGTEIFYKWAQNIIVEMVVTDNNKV
ncbi:hillarin-like [Gigantopelta aegis]|uniref:hillarin-like n=1 Tax=Gigantopelta aegis TaxID=1735272 RepID=UPI001B88A4C0|nr:hillarin-like [Gigantopelta aegis]